MAKCDVCGYEHDNVVQECPDGIFRCKLCRQRREYGRTFFGKRARQEQKKARERGEFHPIEPIEDDHGEV